MLSEEGVARMLISIMSAAFGSLLRKGGMVAASQNKGS